MTQRLRAVLVALGMAVALLPLTAAQASEDPPDNFCTGSAGPLPPRTIVKLYQKQGYDILVPLRCGVLDPQPGKPCNGWGFRHIKCKHGNGQWPDGYHVKIAVTLEFPGQIIRDGTSRTYIRRDIQFKVVWERKIYVEGAEHPHQGVITATDLD